MDQINKAKAAAENIDDEWAAHLTTARATPYQTVKLRRLRFTVWYSVRVAQPVARNKFAPIQRSGGGR